MVGAFGEVQVMDWGLAKLLSDTSPDREGAETGNLQATDAYGTGVDTGVGGSDTRTGSFLGTPAYAPPEQAGGEIRLLSSRSDVFGLGAVLCHVLTGKLGELTGRSVEVVQGRPAERLALAVCTAHTLR